MLHHSLQGEYPLLTLHQTNPAIYPFLLESLAIASTARFSLLFCHPQQTVYGTKELTPEQLRHILTPPVIVDSIQNQVSIALNELPFRGGWFVYLGYEFAQSIEPTLQLQVDLQNLPCVCAVRIPAAIIVDHHTHTTHIIAELGFEAAFQQLCQACEALTPLTSNTALHSVVMQEDEPTRFIQGVEAVVVMQEDEPTRFIQGVEAVKDYIAAGDVFQVNLSRAWQGQTSASAVQLYRQLRQANPAPFAGLAQFGDFSIISSSPERLVKVRHRVVETRPIAGTRTRGKTDIEDKRLLNELMAHPKERAEHIMLIDLERNDMGRICRTGTINVNEMMILESYQHVHHIVSNIRGELQASIQPSQVLQAVFPGGTITGCPKVRCMEIIAELEQVGRGAYTGSMGYINHNGDMDFNILIRTMTLKQGHLVFRTGAGIVSDSVPAHELNETRHKARGLLRALGDTRA